MLTDIFARTLNQYLPLAFVFSVFIYLARNYYNRDLNKHPGPLLCAFTDWYRFFKAWQRRPEQWHIDLHNKYGDISDFYPVQMATSKEGKKLPTLFSTQSEEYHSQLKRSVNSVFSMSAQMQYEPIFDSVNDVFLHQTQERFSNTGKYCDFYQWLQFYTFDVIGELVYSKRHGFLESNYDIEGIVKGNSALFDYAAVVGQIPVLDKLWKKNPIKLLAAKYGLIDSSYPVASFARARLAERHPSGTVFSKENLAWQRNDTNMPQDFLSKFIQAKHDRPDFFNDQLVVTMCVSMAFAGSEPAAVSMSGVFGSLLRNPRCLEKVYEELDQKALQGHFKDNVAGTVTWQESQGLPYLDACIKEAFRLHPAPGLPFERVVPPEGVLIDGEFIKGGTIVGCNAWVIHRRTDIFGDNLDDFVPERWLVDPSKDREAEIARIKDMDYYIMSFGKGPRVCLGKHIGMMEVYKLIPAVLRRFELELEEGSREARFRNGWFVRPVELKVKFTDRKLVTPA
ncbi:cytochrome P450 [Bipolaris maydis]|nr:cytochrome P450 [Bipolaris maydis]